MMTQRSARASGMLQLGNSPMSDTSCTKISSNIIWRLPVYSPGQWSGLSHEYLRWNGYFFGKYCTVVPRYLW